MKYYFFIFSLMLPFLGYSQWTRTELRSQKVKKSQEKLEFSGLYALNTDQLRQTLKNAPVRFSNEKGVVISLPAASGKLERFQVWEYSNMAPELQAKFPDIRSYVGTGLEDPSAYVRFSLSPVGFSSMITRSGISEFIEAYTEDRTVYAVFDSNARRGQDKEPFECATPNKPEIKNSEKKSGAVNKKVAGFNIFRLAITCTAEYAEYHLTAAGTPATATEAQKKAVVLAAMNATLTRLNGVLKKTFLFILIWLPIMMLSFLLTPLHLLILTQHRMNKTRPVRQQLPISLEQPIMTWGIFLTVRTVTDMHREISVMMRLRQWDGQPVIFRKAIILISIM